MTGITRYAPRMGLAAVLALCLWSPNTWAGSPEEARQRASGRPVLVTGNSTSMIVDRDGDVWLWGTGRGSEKGTLPEREVLPNTPERMEGLTGVLSLATSDTNGHTLALLENGTVLSWGSNHGGELGDGTRNPRQTRAPVVGLTDVVSIAAGSSYSLALRADGTVWAWGSNFFGNLGDGTRTRRLMPVQVPGLVGVIAVAAGERHAVALCDDGTVWGWGHNAYGQLGNGTSHLMPAPVKTLLPIVK